MEPSEPEQCLNVDDPDTTPGEKNRAEILEFDPDGSELRVYAYGIRNAVGLAINPQTGELWCSVNERDALGDNLIPDYISHVQDGGFYGWRPGGIWEVTRIHAMKGSTLN